MKCSKLKNPTNLTCLFHFVCRYIKHINMQPNLFIIAMLVVVQSFAASSIETSTPLTPDSPKIQLGSDQLLLIKNGILSLLGLAKLPNPVDRSEAAIPDTIKQLYDETMNDKPNSTMNILQANTARTFTHSGKCDSSNKKPQNTMYNVTKQMKKKSH